MPCGCWVRHFLCAGRRGWFAEGWTVQLLSAVYWNTEAQPALPQDWVYGCQDPGSQRVWTFCGGLN